MGDFKHTSAMVASAALLLLSGCGGGGASAPVNQAVLPAQYVLSTFPLPAQEVTIIGVTDSETVKMRVRDRMFFRWNPSEGRVKELDSSEYPNVNVVDVDGQVAFNDGTNDVFVLNNGTKTALIDSHGAPVQGTPIGFIGGKPVVYQGDGKVWSLDMGVVTLQKPAGSGTIRVEPTAVAPTGRIAGSVYRSGTGGLHEGYSAAFWDTDGNLREVGAMSSDPVQSRLAGIFADGTAVGSLEGSSRNSLARWNWGGVQEIIVQSPDFAQVDGVTNTGFVIGSSGAVTDKTFVWTSATGVRSLSEMTTGFPTDAKSHRIYYPKISPSGVIAGLLDVSDLSNPNAAPVWRGVILRPVR